MTVEELRAACLQSLSQGLNHTILAVSGKYPKGFPRGELLCQNSGGGRVYCFKTWALLKWIAAAEDEKWRAEHERKQS